MGSLKEKEANGKFQEMGGLILDEIIADTKNTYVEVVLGDSNNCKENFHIRTMIKPVNDGTAYAFIGCK